MKKYTTQELENLAFYDLPIEKVKKLFYNKFKFEQSYLNKELRNDFFFNIN